MFMWDAQVISAPGTYVWVTYAMEVKWLDTLQGSHMWWWRSSLHMRHDMESCDQGREDQDEAWLEGSVASVMGKSEALKWGWKP